MQIQFECQINALSFNSRVLKIVDVSDEKNFRELHSLKVGDQPRSLASSLDVSWNKVEVNRIATATGTGYIALWNLSRSEVNRVERIIRPKQQYAMKVCFHHSTPNYLLSATRDDCVLFFDLRQERSAFTFENGGAHVRDVKFAYNSHILFALADDNGMVKFLDVRKPAKPVQLFTAHGGPVLSLDFNPLVENIFATGGRDKIIQIWEYQSTKTKLEDSIITSAPVGQIHWNPLERTQIASSTLTTDFEIQVWDIRRPCLPYAVFLEHTSPVKGFQWKPNSDSLLSASTNGSLIWNNAKNAYQPCKHLSPVAINFRINGDILYVCKRIVILDDSHFLNKKLEIASSTADDGEDRSSSYFVGPRKSCFHLLNNQFYKNKKTYITPAQFKIFAEEYHLTDYCFPDLCQHNANVALKLKRRRESHTWLMLKDFYISGHLTLVNFRRACLRTKESYQGSSESTQSDQGDQSEHDHFIACFGRLFDDDFERETYAPPSARRPEDEKLPDSEIDVSSEGFGASEETLAKQQCLGAVHTIHISFTLQSTEILSSLDENYSSFCGKSGKCTNGINDGAFSWQTWKSHVLYSSGSDEKVSNNTIQECKPVKKQDNNFLCSFIWQGLDLQYLPAAIAELLKTIRGLFIWCPGCMHGGHLNHIERWFRSHNSCPTGCGHKCIYD
ncbi:WD repeat-containing protein 24 [Trichinella murrelli]|uniref:GATOR2 complex protein WDR24 n=1 Tax=Trichinella murrelli TaxID=144512 RepID=A0A0V0T6H0_9BILA|nr:WD repeat-containing protein 24 [Trichinella murrelli]